jgi:hypothetical protein
MTSWAELYIIVMVGDKPNAQANDDRYRADRRKRSFEISRTDAMFAERIIHMNT